MYLDLMVKIQLINRIQMSDGLSKHPMRSKIKSQNTIDNSGKRSEFKTIAVFNLIINI